MILRTILVILAFGFTASAQELTVEPGIKVPFQDEVITSASYTSSSGDIFMNWAVGSNLILMDIGSNALSENEPLAASFGLTVYPNPAKERLTLRYDTELRRESLWRYTLFDLNGRIIKEDKILNSITEIDITQLPSAAFLLMVFDPTTNQHFEFTILKQ